MSSQQLGADNYPTIGAEPTRVIEMVREHRWHAQDGYYRPYLRQVQDNLRMIAGRHWDIWVPNAGKFVNVLKYMDKRDRRWRQRPVLNWIGYWFTVTVAKLTETPPILTFLPATADRKDAMLAEIIDPIYKHLWDETGMPMKWEHVAGWMCGAGAGLLKSYWDPEAGGIEEFKAPAPIHLLDLDGNPMFEFDGSPVTEVVEDAPFGFVDGEIQPLIEALPGGDFQEIGRAHRQRQGSIGVDVLGPTEVRAAPGPGPFDQKPYKVQRSAMHVDEIEERFGIRVEPDIEEGDALLNSLLFRIGDINSTQVQSGGDQSQMGGFAAVYECWERPRFDVDDMEEGRLVVVTKGEVLLDDQNPYDPDFDPYSRFGFTQLPDRDFEKSPVEDMAPINRAYDHTWGRLLEITNLMANPMWVTDAAAGIDQITNSPGSTIRARFRKGVQRPIYALEGVGAPPDLWRVLDQLKLEMQDIGSLRAGSEGRAPTTDASGELVKELRFNDDRPISSPQRRAANTMAKMADKWMPLLRFGWTDERMIRVSGEENAARFRMVGPEMFEGRVNVKAVPESMIAESRGERQKRLDFWVQQQIIDVEQYLDLYQFPHLGRAVRPGGVHRSMAEREHAQMLQGIQVLPIEAHDDAVHLGIHNEWMASPDFPTMDPEVQDLLRAHVRVHEQQVIEKAIKAAAQEAAVMEAVADLVPPTEVPEQGQPQNEQPALQAV